MVHCRYLCTQHDILKRTFGLYRAALSLCIAMFSTSPSPCLRQSSGLSTESLKSPFWIPIHKGAKAEDLCFLDYPLLLVNAVYNLLQPFMRFFDANSHKVFIIFTGTRLSLRGIKSWLRSSSWIPEVVLTLHSSLICGQRLPEAVLAASPKKKSARHPAPFFHNT